MAATTDDDDVDERDEVCRTALLPVELDEIILEAKKRPAG